MKLHLRDLFWLILVTALSSGAWVSHQRAAVWESRAESLRRLVDQIEKPHYVEWKDRGATLVNAAEASKLVSP